MNKTTIEFFIVPNPSTCYDGVSGNGPCRAHLDAYTVKHFSDNVEAASAFGINCYDFGDDPLDVTLSDAWLQVWCVLSDAEDNATDHGIPEDHPLFSLRRDRCPGALPAKFIDKFTKDGDTVVTKVKDPNGEDLEITWVACQGKYRYRNFGNIKEAAQHAITVGNRYINEEGRKALDDYKAAITEKEAEKHAA